MSLATCRTSKKAGVAGAEKEKERAWQAMRLERGARQGFECYFRSWVLF